MRSIPAGIRRNKKRRSAGGEAPLTFKLFGPDYFPFFGGFFSSFLAFFFMGIPFRTALVLAVSLRTRSCLDIRAVR
jgi:hypothetical protein